MSKCIGKIGLHNLAKKNIFGLLSNMIVSTPLSQTDFSLIRNSKQIFSDCYMLSSLDALTKSEQGRRILSENIKRVSFYDTSKSSVFNDVFYKNTPSLDFSGFGGDSFQIRFSKVNGKEEKFLIFPNDKKYLYITQKQKSKIIGAIESAMSYLVDKYPNKKPFISRIFSPKKQNFEYNRASNFLEMFTGKKPYVLAETALNLNLKPYKKQVYALFEKMAASQKEGYSFIAGSGMKKMPDGRRWHCYSVLNVDSENKKITLINKRTNIPTVYSFDEAISKLKYFVGYFNEDLK